ncbi:hypothetical protein AURANDRAFT_63090 [Aureococcus anophagefferens]|uniref:Glycosyltransferase 2-like domain-containing protein n=1 Tax=Aureococcus anophagefferens TaxID=44056 RepID=F0Y5D2_AURAN|nr:hypothetical protein AURANDRAFT_63090 [Aureococcus anophagefferens]EGB09817.1 hypothetical protein AURANDRAFT_63090 [Aureococcus anophagefferens]|eukprot:XP_009035851.1 hypothetical protein AURANDRAFT_63090 [Aureococcus anophagefferens]
MASSSKKITVTIADGSGKACRMQIKADATVEDLAARYGRFRARASEADDDADPPRFRLHRDDGEALKPTLAASALEGELLMAVAVAAYGAPVPEPDDEEYDDVDPLADDDEDAILCEETPLSQVAGLLVHREGEPVPGSTWHVIPTLRSPPPAVTNDEFCYAELVDECVKMIEVVDLAKFWDDREGLGGDKDGPTFREATKQVSVARAVALCVDGFDDTTHTPREAGLQARGVPWPEKRDDAGHWAMLGYGHAAAAITASLLAVARPKVEWKVVAGPHYACVVGEKPGVYVERPPPGPDDELVLDDGTEAWLVDAAAPLLEYHAKGAFRDVVKKSGFMILGGVRDGDHVAVLEQRSIFKRRPVPAWAPVASPEDMRQLWATKNIDDGDKLGGKSRLDALPTRPSDALGDSLRLFPGERAARETADNKADAPAPPPKVAGARPGDWLALKTEGTAAFRKAGKDRGAVEDAYVAYSAALDALRRCDGDVAADPGDACAAGAAGADAARFAAATCLGNRSAAALALCDFAQAAADAEGALAWLGALSDGARRDRQALLTEKRARLAARRQRATASLARRAPRDWPFASVVMPTTPDRLHFAERGAARALRCFLALDYPGQLELVVLDDESEDERSLEFWKVASGRDRRVRYACCPARSSLGHKRNVGAREALGSVLLHFDDDDVYGPGYARTLVAPVAFGGYQVAKLSAWLVWDAHSGSAGYVDLDERALTDARACPAMLAPLLRKGRDSYGFNFCYAASLARKLPFPEIGFGEDAAFIANALRAKHRVAYVRDGAASVLHVQHGENASRSIALSSCGEPFLRASPLWPSLGAADLAATGGAARADGKAGHENRGLFVFDTERLAARGDDDGAMVSLLSWVQSDAGFAPNRKEKLGLA